MTLQLVIDGKSIHRLADHMSKWARQHRKHISAQLRLVELEKESL
jgi:hypothetical protein